jgi:hypothetical protein
VVEPVALPERAHPVQVRLFAHLHHRLRTGYRQVMDRLQTAYGHTSVTKVSRPPFRNGLTPHRCVCSHTCIHRLRTGYGQTSVTKVSHLHNMLHMLGSSYGHITDRLRTYRLRTFKCSKSVTPA